MRKFALCFILILAITSVNLFTVGCSDRKPAPQDSISDTTVIDTTREDTLETLIEEQPMPKAADELFDDFFFNFAGNKRLQAKRIQFPLPVYRNDKLVKKLEKNQWVIDRFFMKQEYYTLIFDNRKQMDLVKSTEIDHVIVEKILFKKKTVKQNVFDKINGLWMMTSINYKPLYQNKNASFLKFYERFSTDSAFQIKSMADEVTFTAPDPDDDFNYITGTMLPEQWPMFKPGLIPSGTIYNIIYGQKYTESTQKIFVVRGIASGLEIEMTFRKIQGEWKLVKFNS